jgi:hypothetical protein
MMIVMMALPLLGLGLFYFLPFQLALSIKEIRSGSVAMKV